MKNANRTRKLKTLAAQNYGSTSTIGPRQVSILYTIFVFAQAGIPCSVEGVKKTHPSVCSRSIESAFFTLRARRLITGKGRGWTLTGKGEEVARLVSKSNVAAGLGLVAIGMPTKR